MELHSDLLAALRDELIAMVDLPLKPRLREILSEVERISEENVKHHQGNPDTPKDFLEKYARAHKTTLYWSNALIKLMDLNDKIPQTDVSVQGSTISVVAPMVSQEMSQELNDAIYGIARDYFAAANEHSHPTFVIAHMIQQIVFKNIREVLYKIKIMYDGAANSVALVETLMPVEHVKIYHLRELMSRIAHSGEAENGIIGETFEEMMQRLFKIHA